MKRIFVMIAAGLALSFPDWAFAQGAPPPNSFKPLQMTCGFFKKAGEPLVTPDLKVSQPSSGAASDKDPLAAEYLIQNYPYKTYRAVDFNNLHFRAAVNVIEHVFFPKQYLVQMSIYQEGDGRLTLRAGEIGAMDDLLGGRQLQYDIPKSPGERVVCHIFYAQRAPNGRATKKK